MNKMWGVAAMKVYGGAQGMTYEKPATSALAAHGSHDHEAALRYALGLPGVCTAVIGHVFGGRARAESGVGAAIYTAQFSGWYSFLRGLGREVAAEWGPHYGAVE